jgi:hypothetical protein
MKRSFRRLRFSFAIENIELIFFSMNREKIKEAEKEIPNDKHISIKNADV